MVEEPPQGSPEAELSSLKDVDRADVYKNGELAAHLTRGGGGTVVFEYTADWVKNAGDAVATTLPVSSDPVVSAGGAVPAFFAGLLPEGRRLTALRQGVKTSADDELTLLLGVGGDTVGDVRIVPDGQRPDAAPARLIVSSFQQISFADLLRDMGVHVDRVGLPGVQDKVSAAVLNLPVTAAGSSLLLKLNPPEFKHLVENEHFFLGAARRSRIRTVAAELVFDRDGAPGLAVSRFDRLTVEGKSTLLPVEDGCQALNLHPADKYRVRTETLFAKLASLCEAPIPAAADYLAQYTFAFLSGNGDAHAKNFSVMRDPSGRWQPTPAYDVPTSQPYGDQTLALSVDGRRDGNITGSRFVALGEAIGLRPRAAAAVVRRIAKAADEWIDEIEALPFDPGTRNKLKRVIATRQRLLLG